MSRRDVSWIIIKHLKKMSLICWLPESNESTEHWRRNKQNSCEFYRFILITLFEFKWIYTKSSYLSLSSRHGAVVSMATLQIFCLLLDSAYTGKETRFSRQTEESIHWQRRHGIYIPQHSWMELATEVKVHINKTHNRASTAIISWTPVNRPTFWERFLLENWAWNLQ